MSEAGEPIEPHENKPSAIDTGATDSSSVQNRVTGRGRIRVLRLRRPWQELALALAAGSVHALSFAPANLPWLELLALGLVFWLALGARSVRHAAAIGFAFGLGWFGVGVSWIYISLHRHGDLSMALALLATAALASVLALFPAGALAAGASVGASGEALHGTGSVRRGLALAAAWTLADWLRGVVFTGFPWLATGYAHTDGPLAGYAPLVGVYGVGAIAAAIVMLVLWAGQVAVGSSRRRAAAALLPLALGTALLGAGLQLHTHRWSQDHGRPLRVRIVQGNIDQDLKFGEGGLDRAIARYLPTLESRQPQGNGPGADPPDLIVFPESAFPVPVNDLPDAVLQALTDEGKRSGAALVFGAFIVEPPVRYFNSAIGLGSKTTAPQRYSKRHLVPFGEFIPFGMHWFVQMLQIPIGDQQAGDEFQPPMDLAGQQIAVNICFEDLFGSEILAAWHDPQRQPTVLLNLSNLAWFDDSLALPQHLQISRMRALETARPLLRATNTGVTAIIDERGRVLAQLPTQSEGVLEGVIQGKTGATPFIRWGNTPALLVAALVLMACRPGSRRKQI